MLKRKVETSVDVTSLHADDGNEGTSVLKKTRGKGYVKLSFIYQ